MSATANLDGNTDTRRRFVSANATGHYDLGFAALRPKLAVFWGNSRSDAFAYTGSYAGYAIQMNVPKDDFDYGTSELSAELSRTYAAGGTPLTPYRPPGRPLRFRTPQ